MLESQTKVRIYECHQEAREDIVNILTFHNVLESKPTTILLGGTSGIGKSYMCR